MKTLQVSMAEDLPSVLSKLLCVIMDVKMLMIILLTH